VTRIKRSTLFPDLPTMDEAGITGFNLDAWAGLVAPAGTPPEIIAALNRATLAALKDAELRKSLAGLGVDIVGSSPEEFAAYIKAEIPKWAAVIKASGAHID